MNNVGEKFLPIGTVVMLNGGTKRVMITGFCSMATDNKNVVFDYSGCMYPEGFLSSDQTALFNHDQIAQVYHMGLVDDEEKKFKEVLNTLVSKIPGSSQTQQAPESSVPPVGPGLPGYVGVQPELQSSAPVNTTGSVAALPKYKFDENGVVVAAE